MTHIIGICGRKQSGKTTSLNFIHGYQMKEKMVVEEFNINKIGELVVTALFRDDKGGLVKDMGVLNVLSRDEAFEYYAQEKIWPFVKAYNFADLLKDVCVTVLGLSPEQCFGSNDDKNSLTQYKWENMPGVISTVLEDKYGNTSEDYGLKYHKGGNMTAREVLQYVGTNIFRKMNNNVWVDSVINRIKAESPEIAVIGDCRFKNEAEVIKAAGGYLVYLKRNPYPEDSHDSEKDLDDYDGFDLVIDNRDMTIAESNIELLKFLLEKKIVKPLNLY